MRTRTNKKKNGFSLLELVAVVTLIGIVAAVTMYRLNSVDQATAKQNVAAQNVNLLQSAVERYRFDNGDFPADVTALVTGNYMPGQPKTPHTGGTYAISAGGVVSYTAGS